MKLRFSVRQLERLALAVRELGMSRSWLLREAISLGFPLFVEKVRQGGVRGWRPARSTGSRMRLARGGGLDRMVCVRIAG